MHGVIRFLIQKCCEASGIGPNSLGPNRIEDVNLASGCSDFPGIGVILHFVGDNVEVVFVVIDIIEVVHDDTFNATAWLELG